MNYLEALRTELAQEAAATRNLLACVPLKDGAWAPHPKSMSLARLASHVAEILDWIVPVAQAPELSFNMKDYQPKVFASTEEMLASFDKSVSDAEQALDSMADAALAEPWQLKVDGKVVMEMPKAQVMRTMVMNHLVHHRGQLTVYLRLRDVPLPCVYGPTADTRPES